MRAEKMVSGGDSKVAAGAQRARVSEDGGKVGGLTTLWRKSGYPWVTRLSATTE